MIGNQVARTLLAMPLAAAALLACSDPVERPVAAVGPDGSVAFEPNVGQAGDEALFLARADGYMVALFGTGLEARPAHDADAPAIGMAFAGANPSPVVAPAEPLGSASHYFIGNDPSQWKPHVPHYAQVRYASLYPGIDAVFYGNGGRLEYDLEVAPGADPGAIALDIHGVDALHVDAGGRLVLGSGPGAPVQDTPLAYQVVDGARRVVESAWRLLDADTAAFALGAYDPALPLVIDPVLRYSSYLGGTATDTILDVAVDPQGRTWVAGTTDSATFARQASGGGLRDAQGYACRFARPGALPSCIFVGGSGSDGVNAVAFGRDGSLHLAGSTESTDFPTLRAHQPALGGRYDMFAMRFGPALQAVEFATYLGGNGIDFPVAVVAGVDGSTVVLGNSDSDDFPATPGAFQDAPGGMKDMAVASFAQDGRANFATLLGGSGYDWAEAGAITRDGEILVVGTAGTDDFPVLDAFQPDRAGSYDAVLARLHAGDGRLLQATFLGGPMDDRAMAVQVARNGDIVVAGRTGGDGFHSARPVAGEPADKHAAKGFVARLDARMERIAFSALLGNSFPPVSDMQLDAGDNIHVVGEHDYWHLIFEPAPWADARVVVGAVSADGRRLLRRHAYEGAPSTEVVCCLAVDADGDVLVAGGTNSPIPLVAAQQPRLRGTGESTIEGFMAVFGEPALRHWRGDFDGDGVDDILWRNDATGEGSVWYGADARTAANLVRVANLDWRIAGIGDFDGDGRSDVLWRNARTGANTIWRGAVGHDARATTGVTNLDWQVHAIGDFDGNGVDDIAWHNVATGDTAIWHDGEYAGSRPLVRVTNLAWDIVGAGDFDGDGVSDLAWRHARTGENAIWRGGDYRAQLPVDRVGGEWHLVAIADFDGTGRDALLWRNMVDGRNVAWPGASRAKTRALATVAGQWWHVAGAGDYDGDGRADVAWRDVVRGTNVVWRSGDAATQRPVRGVTDIDWWPGS